MKNKILKKINKKLSDSDNFFDGEINEILNIVDDILTKCDIENNNLKFIDKIINFCNNCINFIKEWCNECKLKTKN